MKILIYSSAYFSDGTLPLFREMKRQGFDVTLLFALTRPNSCLFDTDKLISRRGIFKATEYDCFRQYENYCNLDNVYVENNPYGGYMQMKTLVSVLGVMKFIKSGKYDLIITDTFLIFWKFLLLKYRKRIINVIHEPFIREGNYRKLFNYLRNISFKFLSKIVLLNNTVKDDFCRINKVNPSKVFVNKLGPFNSIVSLVKSNKPLDRAKVVFWGRIASYKGVEYLCEAILLVHKKNPNVKLVIAGGGSFYFDITPYQKLPFITIDNRFLTMSELAEIISDSAFVVCPYTSVTQSGPVITSLVLGKPVVGTDLVAMREMITDGETGLLVPPRDVYSLAEAILKLINDVQLQKRLQDNVKRINDSDETWTEIVNKYMTIYNS